jgi:thermitase
MSFAQRLSLMAGTLAVLFLLFILVGSMTQVAKTQAQVGPEDPTFQEGPQRKYATGEIIVKLQDQATQADLRALNARNDASVEEDLPSSDVNVVDLPQDLTVQEAVQTYEASPDVEYAEPNFKLYPTATPNDPSFNRLWGMNNTGQSIGQTGTLDADIDAPEAWNVSTGNPTTVVAVIDEGIDINHPDLKDNIWRNPDEVPGDGVDNDGNGYVDDINGYDFANDDASVYDPDPITGKGDEHGTHVAGTIAATGNNGVGVTGANWDAQVASLKFLGANGGYTSDAVEAVNYAVKERIPISNNSWGGGGYSQSLRDAIARADAAGHLFVAAAGNGGADGVGDNNDATPHYPSNYDVPNVISVAATDNRDALASFSNYGNNTVDLAAPGVDILSTLPGNRYGYYSGTSMATPHVTGVAALIKSQTPTADDAQLKGQILQFVDKKSNLTNRTTSDGRLNALRALTQSADTTDPTISDPKPAPGRKTKDRTPTISALVDDNSQLTQANVQLYLDGSRRTAVYDPTTERLEYDARRLSYSRHTVRIVAKDNAGNVTQESSRFLVVR